MACLRLSRRFSNGRRLANKSRGISLVGVLVIIGILALAVILLLPVTHNSRDTGYRQAMCKSNMDQTVTAAIAHEQARKAYPVGADPLTGHTGLTHLLPYLGAQVIFDAFNDIGFDKPITDKAFAGATELEPPIFCCPSDPASDFEFYVQGDRKYSRSNFVLCFGSGATWDNRSDEKSHGVWRVGARSASYYAKDGDSKTALISEVVADPGNGIAGIWSVASGGASGYTHSQTPINDVWSGSADGQFPNFGTKDSLQNEGGRAGSHHADLVNVAFVDAHVESISIDVNSAVWHAMGTAAGGDSELIPDRKL